MWRTTKPHYFPLLQAQDDLQRGIPATETLRTIYCSLNAAPPEPPKQGVEQMSPRIRGRIVFSTRLGIDSTIGATNSTLYMANHHSTLGQIYSAHRWIHGGLKGLISP